MVNDFFDLELFRVRNLNLFVFLTSYHVFFWNLSVFLLFDLIALRIRFVALIFWCVSFDVTEVILLRCEEVDNDFFYGHRTCGF